MTVPAIAMAVLKAAERMKLYLDQNPTNRFLHHIHESQLIHTVGKVQDRFQGAHVRAPLSNRTGLIWRIHFCWGNSLCMPQMMTGSVIPIPQPTINSVYCPSFPNIFLGPSVPHNTEAAKN